MMSLFQSIIKEENKYVILDDDVWITSEWKKFYESHGKNLMIFNSCEEFLNQIFNFPPSTTIILDYFIGEQSGVFIAQILFEQGYRNLHFSSGNYHHLTDQDKKYFKSFIKDKMPIVL